MNIWFWHQRSQPRNNPGNRPLPLPGHRVAVNFDILCTTPLMCRSAPNLHGRHRRRMAKNPPGAAVTNLGSGQSPTAGGRSQRRPGCLGRRRMVGWPCLCSLEDGMAAAVLALKTYYPFHLQAVDNPVPPFQPRHVVGFSRLTPLVIVDIPENFTQPWSGRAACGICEEGQHYVPSSVEEPVFLGRVINLAEIRYYCSG